MPKWLTLSVVLAMVGIAVAIYIYTHPSPHDSDYQLGQAMSSPSRSCFSDTQDPHATLQFRGATASPANGIPFIQCGISGFPALANGQYEFVGKTFAPGSKLLAFKAEAGIDQESSSTERQSAATWIVFYYGQKACTVQVRYGKPRALTCSLPSHTADLSRLRIVQHVRPSDPRRGAKLWAGLIDPIVVVQEPS